MYSDIVKNMCKSQLIVKREWIAGGCGFSIHKKITAMRRGITHTVLNVCAVFFTIAVPANGEELTHIQVFPDSSGIVYEVSYDLLDSDPTAFFEVKAKVTQDHGQTYLIPKSVNGDIGFGISPGTGKHFFWKSQSEPEKPVLAEVAFQLESRRLSEDETGSVTIEGLPPDAEIFLNEKSLGLAPLRLIKLPVGIYMLRITKEGYEDYGEEVVMESGKVTHVVYSLQPVFGYVFIEGIPDGADVFFNGEKIGETPMYKKRVRRGYYEVKISRQGYVDLTTNIEVVSGQTAGISYDLQLVRNGFVTFKGFPVGAEVFLDGERIGETPIVDKEIQGGSYTVTVKRKGFEVYRAPLDVLRAQKIEFSYRLIMKSKKEAFRRSLLIPGRGQRYLENTTKGDMMTGLQIAAIGGVIAAYLNASNAVKKYHDARTIYKTADNPMDAHRAWENMKTRYDKAHYASNGVYFMLGAAAGVYLWNVIDAAFIPPERERKHLIQSFHFDLDIREGYSGVSALMRF